ncbi:FAD-dependent monooxygenase [Jiangella ureilytica]|uniref:FAD-dependent monooxygenase n=1 Tax=Jiangella ureilytica TaxID=2530374 RepID=UPI001EEFDA26|nr:FAD-dependent monooxygenase [Jiangella ureilytica]
MLLAGAKDVPIRWGTGPERIVDGLNDVEVTFTDGSSSGYDLVIGADGAYSTVRQLVFDDWPAQPIGAFAWRFLAASDAAPPVWSLMLGGGSAFLTIPVGAGRVYCYCDGPPSAVDKSMRQLLAGYAEPVPTLLRGIDAAGTDGVVHGGRLLEVAMPSWLRGTVLLVGDAAHATSPNMAQGAAMALEDAVVLAESLAASPTLADGLRAYELRRRPRTNWVLAQTRRRDKLRRLPPLARNAVLRRWGRHTFIAGHRPLRDQP